MAQTLCPVVSAKDRLRLAAIIGDRNRSRKHAARARIVLLSADRLGVAAIAREAGISRPAVWRRQRRYAEAGVDGLLREDPEARQGALGRRRGASGRSLDLRRAAG